MPPAGSWCSARLAPGSRHEFADPLARSFPRMTNYFTLMSYILTWAPKGPVDESDKAWMHLLGEAIDGVKPLHAQMLSTLTLLSNSLLSGQSLPPYLPLPRSFELMRHLLDLGPERPWSGPGEELASPSLASSPSYGVLRDDRGRRTTGGAGGTNRQPARGPKPEAWNLLDARNMEQQGYTEFAVLQVCSTLIVGELRGLIDTVADLVGTVDFSFRVDHGNPSESSLESVHTVGTWASRAATFSSGGLEGRSTRGKGKGKNE